MNDKAHEQTISDRLMLYLQHLLPDWDVDVGYNRHRLKLPAASCRDCARYAFSISYRFLMRQFATSLKNSIDSKTSSCYLSSDKQINGLHNIRQNAFRKKQPKRPKRPQKLQRKENSESPLQLQA